MIYIAKTSKRVMAFLIDGTIVNFIWWPISFYSSEMLLREGLVRIPFSSLGALLLLSLFYKWVFLYFLGGTLGKLILGLRVVPSLAARDLEGGESVDLQLGFLQSLLRVLVGAFSLFLGGALYSLAFLRLDRRHVADWVAETQVIQLNPHRKIFKRRIFWGLAFFVQMSFFQMDYIYKKVGQLNVEFKDRVIEFSGSLEDE